MGVMTPITVRPPTADDAAAITDIDAQGLATGHATFRDTPYEWRGFQASFLSDRGLGLVAVREGRTVAWAGVSPTSKRPVYRGVGEVSIYVAADCQGVGVGRQLFTAIITASEASGYWTLVSQIFPENEGSLALHAAMGFHSVGVRQRLGLMPYGPMAGQWRDVMMLERRSSAVG